MKDRVRRIFVEKRPGFDIEARGLFQEFKRFLGIQGLRNVRVINRYDLQGVSGSEYDLARLVVFAEPMADCVSDEEVHIPPQSRILALEYLPGQYDQRADSAAQCVQILTRQERPAIRVARLVVLEGEVSEAEYGKIRDYCLNPLESREADLAKPVTLEMPLQPPENVKRLEGFLQASASELDELRRELGLAMSAADLEFCCQYFRDTEKRDPSITEIRVLDTYWSDHCRHTTFLSRIEGVEISDSPYLHPLRESYRQFLSSLHEVYGDQPKDTCLMNIATLAAKVLAKRGQLEDLDVSEEVNACSIQVEAHIDGKTEPWLVMFKSETHNHPTEIEPFGGAATCLGGAIRDPLSGRSYVYHAMRVTGSGDPRVPLEETLPGKLPQSKITRGAAAGFSSYGNQIGLATGQVAEVYDPGFVAKRMEIGAVLGAVPRSNVVRENPLPGDVVILLGGRTGRDGCGGATGSSKEHTEESLLTCGAEVQKGNPPTERKLQRLFRIPQVSQMIKRCNDFGAGGVSVAIGELTDGLDIDLDAVPRKYEGLDGTELAISESQERMAVVVARRDVDAFCTASARENLEATPVATVTADGRLRMTWRGQTIVNISRAFLNTNGVRQSTKVSVVAPDPGSNYFKSLPDEVAKPLAENNLLEAWMANLQRLNVCSQKGLVERFDSTIGAGSVLLPYGGHRQWTPAECMAATLPVLDGETSTATLMAYGYNPLIGRWSPFHGAIYAIVEASAKITASGGDFQRIRLSLQEYFEKLGQNSQAWGKPFAALLGAFYAQLQLGIPAIGGKDSMSGTFQDLAVPPTVVAFAVCATEAEHVISPEFKKVGSRVVLVSLPRHEDELPDFQAITSVYNAVHDLIVQGKILAAHSVRSGGVAEAITKMCLGNWIGFSFEHGISPHSLFRPDYGSLILELAEAEIPPLLSSVIDVRLLGTTSKEPVITVNQDRILLSDALEKWSHPLEEIFPSKTEPDRGPLRNFAYERPQRQRPALRLPRPRVFMPVFPGTNCEVDTERAFKRAGACVETLVFRNLTQADLNDSLAVMARQIEQAQIIMLPGGFSAGDEPDGSGKFIGAVFRNPLVRGAVTRLLKDRDGLILGICNGFQALIKLGLLPYGEICDLGPADPTLTYNAIGRHVSCMVRTKVVSTLSPWLARRRVGDVHTLAVSHGEGRFVASQEWIEILARRGQIATQYVDDLDRPTYNSWFNPNGSVEAIEGISSPDGRILGKMAHSERIGRYVAKNIPGEKDQQIFEAGVEYFL